MPNDIKNSARASLAKTAREIKDVRKDIKNYTNYENGLVFDFVFNAEINGLEHEKIEGLSIVETTVPQKVTLKDVKKLFNDDELEKVLDNLVFTIDYEKTKENLLFQFGIQETLANGIVKSLEKHSKVKVKKVE